MALANTTCSDSATTVFTCSNAGGSAVVLVVFQNDDTAARYATLHACPSAEAATAENRLFNVTIPAEDSYAFSEKIILANGDDLKVSAEVASVVGCTVSYLDL